MRKKFQRSLRLKSRRDNRVKALSRIGLLAFIIIFALIGVRLMFPSHAATCSLVGDLNSDGAVNVFDLSILLSHWDQTGSGVTGDLNNDGVVNVFDLSILLSHWGQSCSGAPVNATLPAITGTATVGQSLGASTGTWTNTPTSYAYQWEDCNSSGASCINISGATNSSYALASGDLGDTVSVVVTATNAGGSTAATSSPTAVVSSSGGSQTGGSQTDCAGTPGSSTPDYASMDACGYPSPDTVGVPAGTTLTPVESANLPSCADWSSQYGELDITGNNCTISGLNIDGSMHITGANATLEDSFIHGNGNPEILIYEDADNTLIKNVEVEAPSSTEGDINNAGGEPAEIIDSYLHDSCGGWLGPGNITNNYMLTDVNVGGDCHVEDGYVPGGNESTTWAASPWGPAGPSYTDYQHNTMLNPFGQTAVVFLDNHAYGPNYNVTENDNLMAGGGYITYGDSNGDGSENIVFTNNRFSRLYYSDGGYYGDEDQNDSATTFTGNIWDDTLQAVQPDH